MNIKTYGPHEKIPKGVILPMQTHGNNIIEIVTGEEDLSDCDGVFTQGNFKLGIKTADCAPICFWEAGRYGILHAGWRGLCNGIIPKMLTHFKNPQVWIGPILPKFEIKRDFCYDQLESQFGTTFFEEGIAQKVNFDFRGALQSILPTAKFDSRSTLEALDLASWRRDGNGKRNVTVITSYFFRLV